MGPQEAAALSGHPATGPTRCASSGCAAAHPGKPGYEVRKSHTEANTNDKNATERMSIAVRDRKKYDPRQARRSRIVDDVIATEGFGYCSLG
jgi:hypothetical protein